MAEKRSWTAGQLAAIETRGRTLLVSAAAGSGKTSVLTERIIRAVTDRDNPIELSRILAVTFTRSAARDLREKLARALREALESEPGNSRLSSQLAILPAAHICTIDSFCLDLVRQYSSALGISRALRIADSAENMLLCTTVMDDLICDLYDGVADDCRVGERVITAAEFSSAADLLTSSKEEGNLGEVLLSLWETCSGYPDGTARITASAEAIAQARSPLDCVGYREAALGELGEFFTHYAALYKSYIQPLAADEELSKKYLPAAEFGFDFCTRAGEIFAGDHPEAIADYMRASEPPKISASKKNLTPDGEALAAAFKELRTAFSKEQKAFLESYFSYSAEDLDWLRPKLSSTLAVIASVVDCYDRRLDYERRTRGVLSFADVEKLALELLGGAPETRSREAEEISRNFDLVFVDEYQDVNPIQHAIFSLISREDNLFMVGDVKQSIYSFRGAAPEVFTSLRRSFPPLAEAAPDGGPAAVDMSSNFRSDRGVVDFVNILFDRAFSIFAERSGYLAERDRLIYAKKSDTPPEEAAKTVFAIFSKKKVDDGEEEEESDEQILPEDEGETMDEIEFVVDEIARLMRSGRYTLGDFAILVRGWKQHGRVSERLAELGIPTDSARGGEFFSSPEILLALCLLNVVDNPRRDVYLAGLMMSPLFGFSADELVAIRALRRGERGESLWEALRGYCEENEGYERGELLLERIAHFRRIAEGLRSDELLWRLYSETDIFALVGEDSLARERLLELYDLARSFEGGSYHGLWHFISYINELSEKGESPGEGAPSREGERVHIITAHSSKGLEFPVCFLCSCESEYNFMSLRDNLVFDGSLGASLRLRSDDGFALVDNPYRNIACDRIRRLQREEELRLLYVALTRARERLYICSSPRESKRLSREIDAFVEGARPSYPLTPYAIFSAKSFFETMLAVLPHASDEERAKFDLLDLRTACRGELPLPAPIPEPPHESAPARERSAEEREEIAALTAEFARRLSFVYPNEALTTLPKKLPVSALRPDLLDFPADLRAAEEALDSDTPEPEEAGDSEPLYHLPRFMGGVDEGEAARRGIATHYFMQFCDFAHLREQGVACELERLRERGFISEADAARVRIDELEKFAASPLLREMIGADEIRRELRFNLNVRASDFSRDPARRAALGERTLLVQGVIDCVFRSSAGELVLVDYKTDRPPHRGLSRAEFAAILRARHSSQLEYYREACRGLFGEEPRRTLIYSLYLGDTVEV